MFERLYLYLLHGEVQEGVLVADTDQALGALTAHAGAQASVQLHHHQFVQAVGHVVRQAPSSDLIVGLDLNDHTEKTHKSEPHILTFLYIAFAVTLRSFSWDDKDIYVYI